MQKTQQHRHRRHRIFSAAAAIVATGLIAAGHWSIDGEAFASLFVSRPVASSLAMTTTTLFAAPQQPPPPTNSDADLLADLPFVPKEVLSKFLLAVGDPLTAGSIQAGYHAGVVSEDDLAAIQTKMPGMFSIKSTMLECQSVETIEKHWRDALEGQPWHVQSMGKLATATIVPLVAKMQEKAVSQANAMKWINENALPLLQRNATVVELLSSSSSGASGNGETKLGFNNTRAKYETDRKVWSASMDVFAVVESEKAATAAVTGAPSSGASAALAALTEGMENTDDELSSFRGSIDVLDPTAPVTTTTTTTPEASAKASPVGPVGWVNAYFVPDDEIKILVVEIDDVLHNVTWKGVD